MDSITVLFTRRRWNPISWLIRWAMPRSRFAMGLSSHSIVLVGDTCYEATMLHKVRKVDRATALAGQLVVVEKRFPVPDLAGGVAWAERQVGKRYDWRGAFGLSLAPGRRWADEDCWFCYEFAAGVLRAAGRNLFEDVSHIGEGPLLAVAP